MPSRPYTASLHADLEHSSARAFRSYSSTKQAEIIAAVEYWLFAGVSVPPTGGLWTGSIEVVDTPDGPALDAAEVDALEDLLVADWNSRYTVKMRVIRGKARDSTLTLVWRDGVPYLVPNDRLAEPYGSAYDPYREIPSELGKDLQGCLRIAIEIRR